MERQKQRDTERTRVKENGNGVKMQFKFKETHYGARSLASIGYRGAPVEKYLLFFRSPVLPFFLFILCILPHLPGFPRHCFSSPSSYFPSFSLTYWSGHVCEAERRRKKRMAEKVKLKKEENQEKK